MIEEHALKQALKEIHRLLGESLARSKTLTFPVGSKRGVHITKEA
ncbi:hypothetical protein SAMN05216406_1083 [Nitrosomonas ureae]|uniref:Uncharacterized protein n=1 Tax=Nitrosomonas ureae TaxID=44577 RepID=A0A1H2E0A1_9PROT|nr:hypothetical protein SAMN05216406_1083 [Nitrosomonas ureae]